MITKEEFVEQLNEIELYPELLDQLEMRLNDAILNRDYDFIEILLNAGANPNPKDHLGCHIDYLRDKYETGKTLEGDLILSILEILLKYGADPNRVTMNNLRAYDRAYFSSPQIARILERYGADKTLREII